MRKEDCFYLGKIVSKHGFKGDVLIKLDTDEPEVYEKLESVFVSLRNNLVPFFIVKSTLHKSNLLRVSFEDVTDEAAADRIKGAEIYLPLTLLPKLSGNRFYYHEVIGFSVRDEKHGDIGKVLRVNDSAAQALLVVEKEGKKLLIPINDHIIRKIDRGEKLLHVNTPEGLVELYLN